jgi:uncharacterized membrane protein (DUF4010 family)
MVSAFRATQRVGMDTAAVADLAVAALVGLAVGVEREWAGKTQGPDARFAGVRTFSLLGGTAGVAGWFLAAGRPAVAAALIGGAAALVVAAYVVAVRRPGATTDGTTEAAALLVLALGTLAGLGERTLAAGGGALAVLALAEKGRVQRWLAAIDEAELRAALQFAVLALVVLPLLPAGPYGPNDAIRPRELWFVVLLFSGLSFAGYVARQAVGTERGFAVTGLLGGLVSSTAVALHHSRSSRTITDADDGLALGVVAACTVLLPRVSIVATVLAPAVGWALVPLLAPPFVVGGLVVWLVLRHGARAEERGGAASRDAGGTRAAADADDAHADDAHADDAHADDAHADAADASHRPTHLRNPLGLGQSLRMAALFQVVLLALAWMRTHATATGLLATAAILGFTDMDALTLSMARLGAENGEARMAARAIAVGVASNTVLKLLLVLVLGRGDYRRHAGLGLLALLAASAGGIVLAGWLTPVP